MALAALILTLTLTMAVSMAVVVVVVTMAIVVGSMMGQRLLFYRGWQGQGQGQHLANGK
jgi:hypothetical protein